MKVLPVESILIERIVFDKKSNQCIGKVIDNCNYDLIKDKLVYYKLLDKRHYTIINDTIIYDLVKLECIFGVEE